MRDDVGCFLLILTEEWIKKASVADVVAQLAMFEEDVHRFPERVIENLDQLLVDESIVRRGIAEIGATCAWQSESHRTTLACLVQC